MNKLVVENLHLQYGDNPILKGVSMTLSPGEVVALLGASGSGKTTLLRSVAGLEQPSQGKIAIGESVLYDSAAGVDMPVEQRSLGSLNVYGTDDGPFGADTEALATAFAGYAAVAVANAGLYASTTALVRNLQTALDSRAVIDQAKGVLMAQHHVSAGEAFDLLVRRSNASNRKVRDVAREIAEEVQREGRP